ncbi:MaoC family dehydratase [Agrobacterium vitis]|uniref:Enoyl-CoA hydratase n=1 Tax=Agrobacterium vitis TaxID=373 RepID=A0A7K1RDP8_AGRVI|nr:MaoC family dehydratase [Agrobacterium vitis]MVA56120.1 enoyl-CoA hydratase [Agrobacterium vitis]
MQTDKLYFEDFPVGTRLPLGPVTVDLNDIIEFATEFDPQPMHLDAAAGEASILGGLAASGWHTCGLLMRMMIDSYILRSYSEGAPGIDFVQWKTPVLAGDTLSGFSLVEEARPLRSRPGIGVITSRHELINQKGETVIVARNAAMMRQRQPAGDAA